MPDQSSYVPVTQPGLIPPVGETVTVTCVVQVKADGDRGRTPSFETGCETACAIANGASALRFEEVSQE